MKILVVEDEAPIRQLLQRTIENLGHEVEIAEDGVSGFDKFKKFEPDIVLSDILMPKKNGLEMLADIRRINADAIVIMVTAFGSADYTIQALRLKANDYIIKPFRPKLLKEYIDKYQSFIETRTIHHELLGKFLRREFELEFGNHLHLVNKLADRLMLETHDSIPKENRLGIHLGLVEMITNAIEHGNLEIDFDMKRQALEGALEDWNNLLKFKLGQDELNKRTVLIKFKMNREFCEWKIIDQGPGFDWKNRPDPDDPEMLLAANGRGITLTSLQFDEMEYNEKGNQVRCRKYLT
ncbi:MAG: response regulator [Candidatus Rifleibacteriota bacterium]